MHELEASDRLKIKKNYEVNNCELNKLKIVYVHTGMECISVISVKVPGVTCMTSHPNNIIQLSDGKIFKIKNIYTAREQQTRYKISDFYFWGYEENDRQNAFDYRTPSTHLGIIAINNFKDKETFIPATFMKNKCVYYM